MRLRCAAGEMSETEYRVQKQMLKRQLEQQKQPSTAGEQLARGDITEEALSLDLVRVVLSDGEEGQEVNAPARARRLLRRASSEIALGHADTVLAARVERAAVGSATVPRVQGAGPLRRASKTQLVAVQRSLSLRACRLVWLLRQILSQEVMQ